MEHGRGGRRQEVERSEGGVRGIVVNEGSPPSDGKEPRIALFIWGGKVRPTPTLPYGRWKGAA